MAAETPTFPEQEIGEPGAGEFEDDPDEADEDEPDDDDEEQDEPGEA
jgi:hypothetical protein